jgi:hypothetical protein
VTPLEQADLPFVVQTGGVAVTPLAPFEISNKELRSNAPDPDNPLDRILTARPQHFQRSHLDQIRGYAYKWLLLQRGRSQAPPPDDYVCARLIAAAGSPDAACSWILDHLQDYQAETCEYLVIWMMDKLHGFDRTTIKTRRAQLKLIRRRDRKDAELPAQLAELARAKSMP